MHRAFAAALILVATTLSLWSVSAQAPRRTPYWASISSSQALLRTGPGRNYPGTWMYVRPQLPVQVVEVYQDWRRIRDPDGTSGWMFVRLLSDERTAIVRGNEPAALHAQPDESSPVRYRAEPGVVGRISRCTNGWCRIDVGDRSGFIRIEQIWGISSNETLD